MVHGTAKGNDHAGEPKNKKTKVDLLTKQENKISEISIVHIVSEIKDLKQKI